MNKTYLYAHVYQFELQYQNIKKHLSGFDIDLPSTIDIDNQNYNVDYIIPSTNERSSNEYNVDGQ